jgi:tryptophanase
MRPTLEVPALNEFHAAVREIFGFEHILAVHQGRAAERLMISAPCAPCDAVPGNTHFETTRGNLLSFGVQPVDLPSPEFWQLTEPFPFKGNMDTVALELFLKNTERGKVPFLRHLAVMDVSELKRSARTKER